MTDPTTTFSEDVKHEDAISSKEERKCFPLARIKIPFPDVPVARSGTDSTSGVVLATVIGPFEWGNDKAGTCNWAIDRVWLYSDGRWLHKHQVWSSAIIVGDRIHTTIEVVDKFDYVLASWTVSHGLDPGDYRKDDHQGQHSGIRDRWNEIDGLYRSGSCD